MGPVQYAKFRADLGKKPILKDLLEIYHLQDLSRAHDPDTVNAIKDFYQAASNPAIKNWAGDALKVISHGLPISVRECESGD